jgi:hypothetical protein
MKKLLPVRQRQGIMLFMQVGEVIGLDSVTLPRPDRPDQSAILVSLTNLSVFRLRQFTPRDQSWSEN